MSACFQYLLVLLHFHNFFFVYLAASDNLVLINKILIQVEVGGCLANRLPRHNAVMSLYPAFPDLTESAPVWTWIIVFQQRQWPSSGRMIYIRLISLFWDGHLSSLNDAAAVRLCINVIPRGVLLNRAWFDAIIWQATACHIFTGCLRKYSSSLDSCFRMTVDLEQQPFNVIGFIISGSYSNHRYNPIVLKLAENFLGFSMQSINLLFPRSSLHVHELHWIFFPSLRELLLFWFG